MTKPLLACLLTSSLLQLPKVTSGQVLLFVFSIARHRPLSILKEALVVCIVCIAHPSWRFPRCYISHLSSESALRLVLHPRPHLELVPRSYTQPFAQLFFNRAVPRVLFVVLLGSIIPQHQGSSSLSRFARLLRRFAAAHPSTARVTRHPRERCCCTRPAHLGSD